MMSSLLKVLLSPRLVLAIEACTKSIRKSNDRLTESLMKIKDLGDEINELRRGFGEKVARVAKAAGVEHALNQPF